MDPPPHRPDGVRDRQSIRCDACESVLSSATDRSISFLLLDQLTLPIVSCEEHLEQFSSVCGLTTTDSPDLLDHRPAGGITCPSCRLAPHRPDQLLIPVQDGAVAVVACPEHRAGIVDRFRTGLDTQQQLTTAIDTSE